MKTFKKFLESKKSGLVTYHGTSSKKLNDIKKYGLDNPFLTSRKDIAGYYAYEAIEEFGGNPIILEVYVENTDNLRYDSAAMDEPVMVDEDYVEEEINKIAEIHPEWVKNDIIIIPDTEWKYSWDIVHSVWHNGVISYENIHQI
jgi:hypothetical protein